MDEFMAWAASEGISDSTEVADGNCLAIAEAPVERASCLGRKLTVAHFDDGSGRGLAAACKLSQGEAVLQAPKEVLMSALSARTSDPSLAQALAKHLHLSSHQVVVLHLLHEVSKGPASCWALYLKQLPRRYSTLANFSPEEAQELQVSEAIVAAADAAQVAHSDWLSASPVLRQLAVGPKFCGLQAWLWGAATVSSRSLYVPWDCAGALCPVGDLFNYAPQVEEASDGRTLDGGYEEERGMYRFYARRNYVCGEQVLLCYGLHSNLELLHHYGFILPLNPNDVLRISLPPPHILRPTPQKNRVWGRQLALSVVTEQESEIREAEELGGEVGGGGPGKYSIQADGQPSFCLLAALRILAEPKNVRRKIRHLAISGERVSWEGDVALYNWLQDECRVILRNLPTSAQEDEVLKQGRGAKDDGLNGGSNSQPEAGTKMDALCTENVHLAICWRLGYKLLVSRAIWHCAEMAAQLQEERSGSQPQ